MGRLSEKHLVTIDYQGGSRNPSDVGWWGDWYAGYFTPWNWAPYVNIGGGSEDYYALDVVSVPIRAGYRFKGINSAADGSGYYSFNASGKLTAAIQSWLENVHTAYAVWEMIAIPMTLDQNGGSEVVSPIYYSKDYREWYGDINLTQNIFRLTPPERGGYVFLGYFSATSGGTCYVDATGNFTAAFSALAPTEPMTVYAQWLDVTAVTYTLTFDAAGGASPVASKSVSVGYAVGTLPKPTKSGECFKGWRVGTMILATDTIWTIAADTTAVAVWGTYENYVEDYFGMATSAMVPISSDLGDNKQRICVSHTGPFEPDVDQVSGVWRNPTVTYRIVKDTTVACVLGQAFAATYVDDEMTISGYMITSAEVVTKIGEFPTVTISAAANEGVAAINHFNVSIPVEASAHAQNLLSALSGGGELQECVARATCEPVVIAENLMPAASDVVKGKYSVAAKTIALNGESAPIAANSFTALGTPQADSDGSVPTWTFNAERII